MIPAYVSSYPIIVEEKVGNIRRLKYFMKQHYGNNVESPDTNFLLEFPLVGFTFCFYYYVEYITNVC